MNGLKAVQGGHPGGGIPAPPLRRWRREPNITQGKEAGMQLKTILNHVQKFKSFVC